MNLLELEECLEKNILLYYGRKKVNILQVYWPFNLIDVVYENESSVFTIDIITIKSRPSTEIGFQYQ